MKNGFMYILILLSICFLQGFANAALISASITNPGAEMGDMTGWTGSSFSSNNDPAQSYEGNHFFFSQASLTSYNGVSFNQNVDLSSFTGSISDVYYTTAYKYQTGQRWGYDTETGKNYLYKWEAYMGVNAYSDTGHLFGIGLKLNPSDTWDTANVSLSWRSDWETKRESLSYININGTVMYYNVNSGEPASYNIDTWGAWEGAEPTFIGFDSFNVTVETSSAVPIPGAILLLGSGLLCITSVNRKKMIH